MADDLATVATVLSYTFTFLLGVVVGVFVGWAARTYLTRVERSELDVDGAP